jgi:hypothetical protein
LEVLSVALFNFDGSCLDITINEVKYVPDLCANLFSINKAITNGFNLGNHKTAICLSKGSPSITFDRVIKTMRGSISDIKMIPTQGPVAYIAQVQHTNVSSIKINKLIEEDNHR